MTEKVFWQDPYLTSLDTRIAAVEGPEVRLERTIFFAFSGGQESDSGSIGGYPVREAQTDGLDIRYRLDADHGLAPGDSAAVTIDWDRRYRLMRLHFAAELVLELAYAKLAPVEKIGAHIAEDKARIDFALDRSVKEELPALREAAQAIIESDRPIISAYSDENAQRRYWEVEGVARVPCGGTHLRRTSEVGDLTLKRKNIGKGKERIEITVGDAKDP